MAVVAEIVEGWTGRLTFTLKNDGTAIDGTGLTVSALDIVARDGTVVTTTGDYGWATQASGIVYYDPDSTDFEASRSPYKIRYQLTDGSSKVVWYPNGAPDLIHVYARGV